MRYSTGAVMGRFFDGLKERRILANQCPICKRKQLPPREVCARCHCRVPDFVEVGPMTRAKLLANYQAKAAELLADPALPPKNWQPIECAISGRHCVSPGPPS